MLKSKREKLFSYAKSIGINHIGICDAEFDESLFSILNKRRSYNAECSFTHNDLILRSSPKLLLENAKSVIVCLFPYYKSNFIEGNLSRYATITDYHKIANLKLESIAQYLNSEIEKCSCKFFSDTGPLVDRFLAYKAGLGFFGKNNCLINDDYGSFFFIGYIVTDCEFELSTPLNITCINCGECIKKCPAGALGDNYLFLPQKCISYITQLKDITKEQEKILSNQKSVYGCDICQNVCPHNHNIKDTCMNEFTENEITEINYDDLLKMSNNKFRKEYKNFAFSWRGKDVILKNFTGGTYVKQRKDNG